MTPSRLQRISCIVVVAIFALFSSATAARAQPEFLTQPQTAALSTAAKAQSRVCRRARQGARLHARTGSRRSGSALHDRKIVDEARGLRAGGENRSGHECPACCSPRGRSGNVRRIGSGPCFDAFDTRVRIVLIVGFGSNGACFRRADNRVELDRIGDIRLHENGDQTRHDRQGGTLPVGIP